MTNPDDPITGCSHGGTMDPELRGLTKREHFAAKALGSYADQHPTAEKAAEWALACADLLIAKLNT